MDNQLFLSTIIPTIGRDTLTRAVMSILDQHFDRQLFEVIVVNDTGKPLPFAEWMNAPNVKVLHTNRHNRSTARNTGAAVSRGRYLHFLDDDDWMLPDAFTRFFEVSRIKKAAWIYGAFRLVDNTGARITDIYPDEEGNCAIQLLSWEWLPLQVSMISAESFFKVGGFASLQSLLGGFEDVDLTRQVALNGDMARINEVIACIRAGEIGSTTNYVDMFRQNRQSREKMLEQPGCFTRLRESALAGSKPDYWYGKVIYYYLASLKWNLRRRHLFTAFSRFSYAMTAFLLAGKTAFSRQFWRGVVRPHYPRMGLALQQAGADHLYAETRQRIMAREQGNP